MIDYDDLTAYAPPASSREERDRWFIDHNISIDDLMRVGREVCEFRLGSLEDGAELGSRELLLLLLSVFLFGFELAVRVERDEKPDLTTPGE
jgi:hypothetical protein